MKLTSATKKGLRQRPGSRWVLGAMLAVSGASCNDIGGDDVDGFSTEEWKAVQNLQPLSTEMPRNLFNNQDQDVNVAKLGQMLFYDLKYAEAITVSGPSGMMGETGKVGCVTCHDPNHGWADGRPGPTSHGRTVLRRNTPTMTNLGWYEWFGWTGRHDSMVMHGSGVMGVSGTPLYYAHYLYAKYKDEYSLAFPNHPLDPALDPAAMDAARFPPTGNITPKANAMAPDGPYEKMTPEDRKAIQRIQANMGRVWDTYPRMLVTRDSPFERYVRDRDFGALSASAKAGLKLFVGKAACNDCHNGPLLADNKWHNVGVPDPPAPAMPDMGRFADMQGTLTSPFNGVGEYSDDPAAGAAKHATIPMGEAAEPMKGAFRTPMLLNIAQHGPYFHTGLAATLEDVVRHYNKGGGEVGTFQGTKDVRLRPLGLTEREIADLVEFMKTLTGNPPAEEWTQNITKP
jgi:cytochrome c peroxidase